jgi:hypothetical protein
MAAPAEKLSDITQEPRASVDKGEGVMVQTRELPELLRDLSPEELKECEKKLLRKIDLRLLPTLILIYVMNYLDRNAIGAARLGGLEEDLGLKNNQFQVYATLVSLAISLIFLQTCVSILFVGYILMQVSWEDENQP